ncbi:hypothetical protein [Alkaliflexus imshenetskii]|uniref:hypothetical protein n=1 Tax=Alkaliflexus imshenetskii TaxID=286730 RepID=UPI0012F7B51E|nr:hypothetical protein [Alkaliflexus imshenetskii]
MVRCKHVIIAFLVFKICRYEIESNVEDWRVGPGCWCGVYGQGYKEGASGGISWGELEDSEEVDSVESDFGYIF